jgi:hypothetical protein
MSSHEIDPFILSKKSTPENDALRDEEKDPMSERSRLEKALVGARYLVEGHKSGIVPKVEQLLKTFGSYEKFPKLTVQKIADDFGTGEPVIVEAVALVLTGEDTKI